MSCRHLEKSKWSSGMAPQSCLELLCCCPPSLGTQFPFSESPNRSRWMLSLSSHVRIWDGRKEGGGVRKQNGLSSAILFFKKSFQKCHPVSSTCISWPHGVAGNAGKFSNGFIFFKWLFFKSWAYCHLQIVGFLVVRKQSIDALPVHPVMSPVIMIPGFWVMLQCKLFSTRGDTSPQGSYFRVWEIFDCQNWTGIQWVEV